MSDNNLQMIEDEILCYKRAITDVEEKINLLEFVNGVEHSLGTYLRLDRNELLEQKIDLKKRLNELLDKKAMITVEKQETVPIEVSSNAISNYMMFLLNFTNNNTSEKKEITGTKPK